jgi:dTDP-4-amino-4,6-dideoxygalactose transaminase
LTSPAWSAIIATHLYGRMADMESIMAMAARARIPVIEDLRPGHMARSETESARVVSVRSPAIASIPPKNLGALGDGRSDRRQRCGHGRSRQAIAAITVGPPSTFATLPEGRNSRLDEMQAAVLRVKLPHLEGWNARRREIAASYAARLRNPLLRVKSTTGPDDVVHLFVVRSSRRGCPRSVLQGAGHHDRRALPGARPSPAMMEE